LGKRRDASSTTSRQTYLLQRRVQGGYLKKVATFDHVIQPDEVLKRYGQGRYVLKSVKPRFKVIWKNSLGSTQLDFRLIDRKTNFVIGGLVAVAGTEIIGFGLTHMRFFAIEERLDKIEAVLGSQGAQSLWCQRCSSPAQFPLQKHCGTCGARLQWPRIPTRQTPTSLESCARCGVPIADNDSYCTHCGQERSVQVQYRMLG